MSGTVSTAGRGDGTQLPPGSFDTNTAKLQQVAAVVALHEVAASTGKGTEPHQRTYGTPAPQEVPSPAEQKAVTASAHSTAPGGKEVTQNALGTAVPPPPPESGPSVRR